MRFPHFKTVANALMYTYVVILQN